MNKIQKKERINIVTIGHVNHGKSTFTTAVCNIFNNKEQNDVTVDDIDKSPEEKQRGITIATTTVSFETDTRKYALTDCPGHRDYVKNMLKGTSNTDFGILLVSAYHGAMPQTKEHLSLARSCGVEDLVIFMNKIDKIPEGINGDYYQYSKQIIVDLAVQYGFDRAKVKVFAGIARSLDGKFTSEHTDEEREFTKKNILEVFKYFDSLTLRQRDKDSPLFFTIEQVANPKGIGVVAVGKCIKGTAKNDDELEIVGLGNPNTKKKNVISTTIKTIEEFHQKVPSITVGCNAGICLRNVNSKDIKSGQVLIAKGKYKVYNKFKCTIVSLKRQDDESEEGGLGKRTPFGGTGKFAPQFFSFGASITAILTLPENVELIIPGETVNNCILTLQKYYPIFKLQKFALRESGCTIAHGVITEVLE